MATILQKHSVTTQQNQGIYILNSSDRSILFSCGNSVCDGPELASAMLWANTEERKGQVYFVKNFHVGVEEKVWDWLIELNLQNFAAQNVRKKWSCAFINKSENNAVENAHHTEPFIWVQPKSQLDISCETAQNPCSHFSNLNMDFNLNIFNLNIKNVKTLFFFKYIDVLDL